MSYLDFQKLEAIDAKAFQSRRPYPWLNAPALLHDEGFRELVESAPPLSLFDERFGETRKAGQQSHDRYALEYRPELALSDAWHGFLEELRSDRYHRVLCRLFAVPRLRLSFHWHYTPNGCSVSPHCDAKRKLGSHIFYLNTEKDWDPDWGGETQVLDDEGRFPARSAPAFEDFRSAEASESVGNWSLLFCRRGNSWHGVREIRCPEDRLRKVFIVVINRDDWLYRARNRLFGAPGYE